MIFYRLNHRVAMCRPPSSLLRPRLERRLAMTTFFLLVMIGALAGCVTNAYHLIQHFYLWPLVRLTGYTSLFVYSLLMLKRRRYNIG